MKNFFRNLFSSPSGESKPGLLSPSDFTHEVAETFSESDPELPVEILGELEVKVAARILLALHNAYQDYRRKPSQKDEIILRVVTRGLETAKLLKPRALDPSQIVPVIKDTAWMAAAQQGWEHHGISGPDELAHEIYNEELILVYAEDLPTGMRYLPGKEIEEAKVKREDLRSLAIANLRRLLPKTGEFGNNGFFSISIGGDYESSLILFDELWNTVQDKVSGEVIIAIPTRDLLLVTGSHFPEGMAQIRTSVAKVMANDPPYRLTDKLFVYRGGKFEVFDDSFLPV